MGVKGVPMTKDDEKNEPTPPVVHDEEWADRTFPDRGAPPSNEVVVDPNAEPSPNIEHPR